MLTATLRKLETVTIDVEGEDLDSVQAELDERCPDGFVLVQAPVAMQKAGAAITATGTYERRDEMDVIEADTMEGLQAKLPEGWQMLSIRKI